MSVYNKLLFILMGKVLSVMEIILQVGFVAEELGEQSQKKSKYKQVIILVQQKVPIKIKRHLNTTLPNIIALFHKIQLVAAKQFVLFGIKKQRQYTKNHKSSLNGEKVLRQKIWEQIKPHLQQFKLLDEFQKYVQKHIDQTILASQLSGSEEFAQKNWKTIISYLKEANFQFKNLKTHFDAMRVPKFQFSGKDLAQIGIPALLTGWMIYWNFCGGEGKVIGKLKDWSKTISYSMKKMRGFRPVKMHADVLNPTQSSQHPQVRKVEPKGFQGEISVQKDKFNVEKAKKGIGKWGYLSKTFRVLFLAAVMYQFVQKTIQFVDMIKKYHEFQGFYGQGGQYHQLLDQCIHLMRVISMDFYNMAQSSRAIVYEYRILAYAKMMVHLEKKTELQKLINDLDPYDIGVTQQFIDQAKQMMNLTFIQVSSTDSYLVRMKNIKKAMDKFFQYKIKTNKGVKTSSQIFLSVSKFLSNFKNQYTLLTKKDVQYQTKMNMVFNHCLNNFKKFRDSDFESKQLSQKKEIDKNIMLNVFKSYAQQYAPQLLTDLNDQQCLQQLLQRPQIIKDFLFNMIISFTDRFYYDEQLGLSLFGKDIMEAKHETSFGEIFDRGLSNPGVIPQKDSDPIKEKQLVDKFLKLAEQQNQKMNYQKWSKQDNDTHEMRPQYRYHCFNLITDPDPDSTEKMQIMTGGDGLVFFKNDKLFIIEKDLWTGKVELTSYLQMDRPVKKARKMLPYM